jgi:O-methyltransferase involved in polyketide biosynthesis
MPIQPLASNNTADSSKDWLELGQNSGQRSAEIVAGIRAITFPSPEMSGLSSASGRLFSDLLLLLNNDTGIANATGARHLAMTHLVEEILGELESPPKVIVEMAGGFSPRAFNLAKKYPHIKVIEVDQPGVIAIKQERLRRMWGDVLPKNIFWLSADLAATKLSDLVGERAIDIVISEGVLPYFAPSEITRIAASVRASLVPNGIMITDIVSSTGWKVVEKKSGLAAWLLKRQVGQFKGAMPSAEKTQELFLKAGYSFIAISSLKKMSQDYSLVDEVADTSFLVAAHNFTPAINK